MITAIIRAKMCEQLAEAQHIRNTEQFFTVGLFSVLDAMLDCLMKDVLEKLPLGEEVAGALLNHEGVLGQVLDFTSAYERSEWEQVAELTEQLRLNPGAIRSAYLRAVRWTMEITDDLNI